MKHFVIIDGHHLMYRAYWAIPRAMRTSKGQQVNAVFGVASMLLQILKTEEPDYLLFCFDAGDKTFRHTEYAEYKTGRAETPDDFYDQIPLILRMIATFSFKMVADPGFEADDYACAYARLGESSGCRVTIISGDRDLFQLASDRIRVAIPHKGYQAAEYLGPDEVLAKYGVTPAQIPSYKGLVGDASDNLPGVHGIGPKAAAALLQQYGTLQGIYDHLSDIKESWKSKLEAGREQAFFCERMAQLICDMPLPLTFDQLALDGIPSEEVLTHFTELEFVLLTKRLLSLVSSPFGSTHFKAVQVSKQGTAPGSTVAADSTDSAQLSLL